MGMGHNVSAAAMLAAMVILALVMASYPVQGCSGKEMQNVIGSCSNAVLGHVLPASNSGCCQTLRSVNKPCLCSQVNAALKGQSISSFISPQIAKGIRQNCNVAIPQGCPGFGSR